MSAALEARLDLEEARLDDAYESGALALHEYRRLIASLDAQRARAYALAEAGDDPWQNEEDAS